MSKKHPNGKQLSLVADLAEARRIRKERLESVRQPLPPLEQQAIELLSVIYAPVSKSAFAACLNRAGLRTAEGRQFLPAHAEALLTPLVRSQTVQQDGQGYQLRPDLRHGATLAAMAAGRFETFAAAAQGEIKPQSGWGGDLYYRSHAHSLRDVRIALYQGNYPKVLTALEHCARQFDGEKHPFTILCIPFDGEWADTLPYPLYLHVVSELLGESMNLLTPCAEIFAHLETRYLAAGDNHPFARQIYATELIMRGRVADARKLVDEAIKPQDLSILAWTDFLTGRDEDAISHYEQSLTLLKKELGKRKYFLTDIPGMFFIPALLRSGTPGRLRQAEEHAGFVSGKRNWNFWSVHFLVSQVLAARRGISTAPGTIDEWSAHLLRHGSVFQKLFALLAQHWTGGKQGKDLAKTALPFVGTLQKAGYQLLADEMALTCHALGAGNDPAAALARHEKERLEPLHALINRRSSWEAALTALLQLGSGETATGTSAARGQARLAWIITELGEGVLDIQPKEQKLHPSGRSWTAGRAVSLKKLKDGAATIPHLTPQDRKICATIVRERSYYYRQSQDSYRIDREKALPLLIGHPLAFVDDTELLPLEIVAGEPELRASKKKDMLQLTLLPRPEHDDKCIHNWETRTRLKVIEVGKQFRKVAEIIGDGLTIPVTAEQKVLEALGAVSSLITVHSDIATVAANLETRPSDPTPQLLLTPYGDGLRLEIKVRPLGEEGSFFLPGNGGAGIIAEISGSRVQTQRDLRREAELAAAVTAGLPLMNADEEGDGIWIFHAPGDCLELLEVLRTIGAAEGRVVWPEGEKLRVSRQCTASQLKLSVRQAGDWFQLEGSLTLDDGEAVELRTLLELLQRKVDRFVPLGDGKFLALSEQFRKRLEDLQNFTDIHGKGVRCALPALAAMEGFSGEVGEFRSDKGWQQQLQRLREAETLQPLLPSTLQIELRDYQREGFDWLAALAHWSGGACLADDMGLGKTIQALALILSRAPSGPTLVVAPTSVCMNWESEARRFAPTMNPLTFGFGRRQAMLDKLEPFDLVICSYGLLQQEAEMLGRVNWQTIVLDEAQAIKNMATKRSQAAMNLQGGFRLITTGTPVENHLGELWNLFRFIAPGLLGSHRSFSDRFAVPIERDRDKEARERLKKLIRPFILRRTKAQVLSELPPRTEIAIRVELSKEETLFYEALRRSALEKIEGTTGPEGEKRLRILAEIMRLRRACCHPRLVLPESPLDGSKLAACMELVAELRDNGHKALVFSQFVDHLAIVRRELEKLGIVCQYLDGSTTPAERKKRVDAFQAGDGELFLISLKAGGTGLNLTAADYVIHLDPWWNPAVEDQASDRAHRIGQSRPVTIYRLVAGDTIEEKIIALHRTKRDLADALLEGAESGARMSAEDMLELLREG